VNAHRIYGEIRLKLLLDKFEELEWVGCDKNYIHACPLGAPELFKRDYVPSEQPNWTIQPIIILQKK
jgi:hypothetical protein